MWTTYSLVSCREKKPYQGDHRDEEDWKVSVDVLAFRWRICDQLGVSYLVLEDSSGCVLFVVLYLDCIVDLLVFPS